MGSPLVGDDNTVSSNDISSSDFAAVYIQGNNNTISNNEFTGASFGIFKISLINGDNRFRQQFPCDDSAGANPAATNSLTPSPFAARWRREEG